MISDKKYNYNFFDGRFFIYARKPPQALVSIYEIPCEYQGNEFQNTQIRIDLFKLVPRQVLHGIEPRNTLSSTLSGNYSSTIWGGLRDCTVGYGSSGPGLGFQ